MEASGPLLVYLLLALCCNLSRCDLIDSVAEQDVYEAAEEALQDADDNAVAACFANEAGFELTNVQSYAYYGDFDPILEFTVGVDQTSITLHNNNLNLVGTAGMMSYDIEGTDYKAVIAYYTPFNDVFYDNSI